MNLNFPDKVTLIEVGPRDGFQFESKIIPTDLKIEIISCLVNAGVKEIQVVSFVHPRLVPQMADAEALLQRLPKKKTSPTAVLHLTQWEWNVLILPASTTSRFPYRPVTPIAVRIPI